MINSIDASEASSRTEQASVEEKTSKLHITDVYPEFEATSRLETLRATEYNYLDTQGHVYLDYTGSSLPSLSQLNSHHTRITTTPSGNPHSINPTSQYTSKLIEETRARILRFLNAPTDINPHTGKKESTYSVIFTPNATAAARLVGESYPFRSRANLVLTTDNHNSINGLRCFADRSPGCKTVYVPISPDSTDLRIDSASVVAGLLSGLGKTKHRDSLRKKMMNLCSGSELEEQQSLSRGLFAYPAQSNFTGVRHPLSWVNEAQKRGYDVLLDAAAFLPTEQLDLSLTQPEFLIISWYKLFGFPTGVGCLVAKREALSRLSRPWFSGGTVQAATVGVPWHSLNADETAFEDGTVNFTAIPDISVGLDWLETVGVDIIKTRVRCLTGWLIKRLLDLRHSDGSPMAQIYGPRDTVHRGGTVVFNILDGSGKTVDERLVAIESAAAKISLRTGCFCNPGAGEAALGITRRTLRSVIWAKNSRAVSFESFINSLNLPSTGTIRVSFGIASTLEDLEYFIHFVERMYRDRVTSNEGLLPRTGC